MNYSMNSFDSTIPAKVLEEREYAHLRRYIIDSKRFCPKSKELIIKMVDMDVGGQSDVIFSGLNCAVDTFMSFGIDVRISRLTAKEIRENFMNPKDVVDWLLNSHRHFISKSLCLSFVKDATLDPYVLRSWVSSLFRQTSLPVSILF